MSADIYGDPALLAQYLHFHYAEEKDYLPWPCGPREALEFPRRCAVLLLEEMRAAPALSSGIPRVVELGCAVGRASFELSAAAFVEALDYSAPFIRAAQRLNEEGKIPYSFAWEGNQLRDFIAYRPQHACPERIRFIQGDACAPPEAWGDFDGLLMANVLCRLPDPAACLRHLPRLVRSGGVAVITTPCSWSEDFTPPHAWLCGSGSTLQSIRSALDGAFRLRRTLDMPMLIREHARKYQWTVTQASVWERV
jgi:putative 4-mercaptohistidine N1-methyltranferase